MKLLDALIFAVALCVAAGAQLPMTGLPTDVMQTSAGELRITPLRGASFLIGWAARYIYVDPQRAADFHGWPKADLVMFTAAPDARQREAIAVLRKSTTVTVLPGEIPAGSTRPLVLLGSGKGLSMDVLGLLHSNAHGEGYVLRLGKRQLLISGTTACTPGMRASLDISVAFLAIDEMTPEAAAACARNMHPKVLYPYLAPDERAEQVEQLLRGSGIDVRLRNWNE